MKKNLFLITICFMVMLLAGCASTNNGKNENTKENKKVVIATTYPVYDWAKNIIGNSDNIELKYLVDSNVDLHSYSPSATDIVEYNNADLILCIGGESEEWIEDLNISNEKIMPLMDCITAKEEEVIEGMEAEEEEEESDEVEYDEHIWLSIKNTEIICEKIADKLGDIDSNDKEIYDSNAKNYIEKLDSLDKQYEDVINTASVDTLLFGDRFPFRYMVDDYGLNYYAAFVGCSAESEASFETIAFLSSKVDELELNAVCVIGNDHSIADSIINNTSEKNQKIVEFNSMQSISNKECDNYSYIDIMQDNLESLKVALGG